MSENRTTSFFRRVSRAFSRRTAWQAVSVVLVLLSVNAGLWIAAWLTYAPFPDSRATLLLAWTLGLRHAVDADHIAAIDNVTRKLTQEGREPVTVGLWFALGHSTVVVAAAVALAVSAEQVTGGDWGLTGTIVSAGFLFLIAAVNMVALVGLWRSYKRVRGGEPLDDSETEKILENRGILGRWFKKVYNFINRPWKMYPLGLLFGLGFDTATEISLLAISAAHASNGMPLSLVLFLPALFTSGMTLVDTMDGIAMLTVYSWANIDPVQKLFYNFFVTLLSILIALVIGVIQVLSIVSDRYDMTGGIWDVVAGAGEHSDTIGFAILITFVVVLLVSAVVYRFSGFKAAVEGPLTRDAASAALSSDAETDVGSSTTSKV